MRVGRKTRQTRATGGACAGIAGKHYNANKCRHNNGSKKGDYFFHSVLLFVTPGPLRPGYHADFSPDIPALINNNWGFLYYY